MYGIVAIVGRPNVGKSTLFNRLVGYRQAIVDEISGVTRDRQYGICEWCGRSFSVVDTGGFITNSDDIFEKEIKNQIFYAVKESDVVLFMVDVTTEITDMDIAIAELLRKSGKKIILIVNKVDNHIRINDSFVFNKFGFGDLFCISSMTGSGTGELLDEVNKHLPLGNVSEPEENIPRLTIVGRPNVGKSSLTNALLGQERNIVTPAAGTTRDSISTMYNKFGMKFELVDTAGLRKKQKISEDIEFYSVMRAARAIENSDVCILMLDAGQETGAQDVNILRLIERNNKGVVIVVNKWDILEKDSKSSEKYATAIRKKIEPFTDVPIVFTSVTTKQRIFKVLEAAMSVYSNLRQKIPTNKLNNTLLDVIKTFPPPSVKGKHVNIKYITQLPPSYPCFAFFCNLPQYIKEPYKRFLENKLRENFSFTGCPIKIYLRKK